MNRNFKCHLIKIALAISILKLVAASNTYAADINPEIANIGYWYSDEDVRGVIANRLAGKVYIAPAVPNSPELINDVAAAALGEARAGKPALIPVNLNDNHWTAIAIRTKESGDIVVFYNDSFGSSFGDGNSESGQYIEAIRRLVPNAEIIDLQVHQQNDGSSCGAFTAENLILLAWLDQANLTPEAARAALAGITDAKAIRILHLNSLGSLYEKIIISDDIANSQLAKSNIETVTELAFNETANLSSILTNRLSYLHLADNQGTGISAGDDPLNYGVWLAGNLGNGLFKGKDSGKIKHNVGGATIGFDSKIDEDTTLGVAVSSNAGSLKPKTNTNNSHTNFSTNTRSIIGSVYGSIQADERLVLTGNIEFGKLYGKTKYKSFLNQDNGFKLKGELFGANIGANYYLPIASLVLVPSLTGSYEGVKFAAIKQGNLTTGKTGIQKFSITPGLSLATMFEYDNFQLIPQVSAQYSNSPLIKTKKLNLKNASGRILSSNKISIAKDSYNLGASLTLSSSRIEASIGYERTGQSKYSGSTGYIKFRVNI
ncbi:Autotransporter beta-domain protein (plasmid) [Candidatus Trichorickettsia mobilis]|uniref:autotransporter domain-containing protein n=1 Tax=Candidatus Trichorickettsia mobilis TaxID=1346319 RepID=UPI002B2602B6|nr:autotransporter domain-containing protein [Candidatus Trichorickettsia mobilis]WPY01836.1 Autotransporter beta-domain protein [Candidatus Trichorickettsia mobilis]